ncbi:MAG: 6,7-dimethyl-8-ribityllumazine synthase, partial [Aeromicrobium sp.]|nr:6,7-dimethyl-8-ribityllumazine synthase [Aeromicrobium sp.]
MSGHGAPDLSVDAAGARVAIVASRWHTEVMDGL